MTANLTRTAILHKISELTPKCNCTSFKNNDCANCKEIRKLGAALGAKVRPTAPPKPNNRKQKFRHTDDIHATFNVYNTSNEIVLSNICYKLVETKSDGLKRIRKYRNEQEQQSIYITLLSNTVLEVIARYEIERRIKKVG